MLYQSGSWEIMLSFAAKKVCTLFKDINHNFQELNEYLTNLRKYDLNFSHYYKGLIYKSGGDFTSECIRITCTMMKLRPTWIRMDSHESIHACVKGKKLKVRLSLKRLTFSSMTFTSIDDILNYLSTLFYHIFILFRMHHRLPMPTRRALYGRILLSFIL